MVLTKALVLKGVIGATTVVIPTSLMVAYRKEISSYFSSSSLTEFDQGLIDYLDNGGDIKFKVTKGTADLDVNGLTFSENTPITISAKIKVTTDTSDSDSVGTLTDGTNENKTAQKVELQKLHNKTGTTSGTPWTWICEIQLTKGENENTTTIDTNIKNRIFKDSNLGLFGILKSGLGTDTSKKESNKTIIKNFIERCAKARGKFSEISSTNEIKTEAGTINIKFNKKADATNLTPTNTQEFDKWFPQIQSDAS